MSDGVFKIFEWSAQRLPDPCISHGSHTHLCQEVSKYTSTCCRAELSSQQIKERGNSVPGYVSFHVSLTDRVKRQS